jgi:hypothetical protein
MKPGIYRERKSSLMGRNLHINMFEGNEGPGQPEDKLYRFAVQIYFKDASKKH